MGKFIINATYGYRIVDTVTNEVISYGGDYYISVKAFENGRGICALSEDDMECIENCASPETMGYTRDKLRKEVREYLEDNLDAPVPDEILDSVCIDILGNNTGEDVMTTLDCIFSDIHYMTKLENEVFARKPS